MARVRECICQQERKNSSALCLMTLGRRASYPSPLSIPRNQGRSRSRGKIIKGSVGASRRASIKKRSCTRPASVGYGPILRRSRSSLLMGIGDGAVLGLVGRRANPLAPLHEQRCLCIIRIDWVDAEVVVRVSGRWRCDRLTTIIVSLTSHSNNTATAASH